MPSIADLEGKWDGPAFQAFCAITPPPPPPPPRKPAAAAATAVDRSSDGGAGGGLRSFACVVAEGSKTPVVPSPPPREPEEAGQKLVQPISKRAALKAAVGGGPPGRGAAAGAAGSSPASGKKADVKGGGGAGGTPIKWAAGTKASPGEKWGGAKAAGAAKLPKSAKKDQKAPRAVPAVPAAAVVSALEDITEHGAAELGADHVARRMTAPCSSGELEAHREAEVHSAWSMQQQQQLDLLRQQLSTLPLPGSTMHPLTYSELQRIAQQAVPPPPLGHQLQQQAEPPPPHSQFAWLQERTASLQLQPHFTGDVSSPAEQQHFHLRRSLDLPPSFTPGSLMLTPGLGAAQPDMQVQQQQWLLQHQRQLQPPQHPSVFDRTPSPQLLPPPPPPSAIPSAPPTREGAGFDAVCVAVRKPAWWEAPPAANQDALGSFVGAEGGLTHASSHTAKVAYGASEAPPLQQAGTSHPLGYFSLFEAAGAFEAHGSTGRPVLQPPGMAGNSRFSPNTYAHAPASQSASDPATLMQARQGGGDMGRQPMGPFW